MRGTLRFPALFACLILIASILLPVNAAAAGSVINVANASAGYFTVAYSLSTDAKMKVGVTHADSTVYYDYVAGAASTYTFTQGDGDYTITLYRNTTGTSYRKIESVDVSVSMDDPMAPYLASTAEITFSQEDAVGQLAAQLCAGLTDDAAKAVAIHNYIAGNFTYDHAFADQIASGGVKNYTPNTNSILAAGKGVCYDFSALYAAMCRSQGIPCAVAKGYRAGVYHAWNMVYVDGQWNPVDLTASIAHKNTAAASLSDCVISLELYTDMKF